MHYAHAEINVLKLQTTYSINVLWGGGVGSIGSVALKGEVVFGSKRDQKNLSCIQCKM